jgi:hypothetical protein
MSEKLNLSVSPHIHSGTSTRRIMLDVLIALTPALIAGTVIFGLRSLLVTAVCVASCVLFEFVFNLLVKKDQTISDLSAAVIRRVLRGKSPFLADRGHLHHRICDAGGGPIWWVRLLLSIDFGLCLIGVTVGKTTLYGMGSLVCIATVLFMVFARYRIARKR